jgi:hypothetical protein
MNGTPTGGIQFNHVPFFKAWSEYKKKGVGAQEIWEKKSDR